MLKTITAVVAATIAGIASVDADQGGPKAGSREVILNAIICKSQERSERLHKIFVREQRPGVHDETAGWERFSVEHGRSYRHAGDGLTLEKDVCIYAGIYVGFIERVIRVNNALIFVMRRVMPIGYGTREEKPDEFGPYHVFSVETEMPDYGTVATVDKPLGWYPLFTER